MDEFTENMVHSIAIVGCSETLRTLDGGTKGPLSTETRYMSEVLHFYPPSKLSENSIHALPMFCFPGVLRLRSSPEPNSFIPFVFTDEFGNGFFASCFSFDEVLPDTHNRSKMDYQEMLDEQIRKSLRIEPMKLHRVNEFLATEAHEEIRTDDYLAKRKQLQRAVTSGNIRQHLLKGENERRETLTSSDDGSFASPREPSLLIEKERGARNFLIEALSGFSGSTESVGLPWSSQSSSTNSRNQSSSHHSETQSGGKQWYVRKAICILSSRPYFSFFRHYLRHMYATLTSCTSSSLERYFSNLLYELPMIPPGSAVELCVQVAPSMPPLSYSTPGPRDFPLLDVSLRHLFQVLDVEKVVILFTAVLTERRILLCSRSYSLITYSAQTLLSLIYPFEWQFTYIPILPESLLDYVEAQEPFIMGIHRQLLDQIPNRSLQELLVFDLDHNRVLSSTQLPVLPTGEYRKLISHIRMLLHPEVLNLDTVTLPFEGFRRRMHPNQCPPTSAINLGDSDGFSLNILSEAKCDRQIRVAFLTFFLSMLRNFQDYILDQPTSHFNKESYLEDTSEDSIEFMSQFVETVAFRHLVSNSLPFLFDCLISKKMTIAELREMPQNPEIYITLSSPLSGSEEAGPKCPFPRSLSIVDLDHYVKTNPIESLKSTLNKSIVSYPEISQLYLFRAITNMRHQQGFNSLRDFAIFYQLDNDKEYPPVDQDMFHRLLQEVPLKQLETISRMKGPIAGMAQKVIDEGENPIPAPPALPLNPCEPTPTLSSAPLSQSIFADVDRPLSMDPKGYMKKEYFEEIAFTIGLVPNVTIGSKLFDILTASQKRRGPRGQIRNDLFLNLYRAVTETFPEENKTRIKKLGLPVGEEVLASFNYVSNQRGQGGDLFFTSKRILFRVSRHTGGGKPRSYSWSKVIGIERVDFNYVIGHLTCIAIQKEGHESRQKKGSQFRFWSRDRREHCFMIATELYNGFRVSRQLKDPEHFLQAQKNVVLVETAYQITKSRSCLELGIRSLLPFADPDSNWCSITSKLNDYLLNLRPDLPIFEGKPSGAVATSSSLLDDILRPFFSHVKGDFDVDFPSIRFSSIYDQFCIAASEFHKMNLSKLSQAELLAFFSNVYNTLIVHAYIVVGFPISKLEYDYIKALARYSICGMLFSLDDILHGILRGNRHPTDRQQKYFLENDPRAQYALREPDPSILFLLTNHLPHSPYVRNIGTCERLSTNLKLAVTGYVQEHVLFSAKRNKIYLPPIFLSTRDFGQTDQEIVRNWVLPYLDQTTHSRKQLQKIGEGEFQVKHQKQVFKPQARPLISFASVPPPDSPSFSFSFPFLSRSSSRLASPSPPSSPSKKAPSCTKSSSSLRISSPASSSSPSITPIIFPTSPRSDLE